MEHLYNKLTDIVEKEALCLEEFLTLLIDQQDHMVENDMDSLREGIARQEQLIGRVKDLEKQRLSVVAKFSDDETDPRLVNISTLAKKAGGEIADKLTELQNTLLSLYRKIEKAKRKNEFLIENSMKYIEGTIQLIADKGAVKQDYAPRNKQDSMILSRTV